MGIGSTEPPSPAPILPGRRRLGGPRIFYAVSVAVVVALGAYGTLAWVRSLPPPGVTNLVVYTYPSLFGGSCQAPAFSTVFGDFATAHHVHFTVECPSGLLSNTLANERSSPRADLVIGLDEITAPIAEKDGLVVPYSSPQLSDVPAALVAELSPTHGVTPYEYGYLALDYSQAFANLTLGRVGHSEFPDFAANSTWSRALTVENPTVDITGEEFLLWQIAYYESILHENWTLFWQSADRYLQTAPDWSTAFGNFTAGIQAPVVVASYSTDPAYALYSGSPGSFNATVSWHDGTAYGWRTIYGIGIVAGSAHVALDQQFVDWFLQGPVQQEIPTNEWEYPANSTTPIPSVFAASIDPASVVPLNAAIPPTSIPDQVGTWLNEWQQLELTYG